LGPFDTNEDGGMLKNTRKTNSSFNNSWISRLFYRCLMHENLKGDGEKNESSCLQRKQNDGKLRDKLPTKKISRMI
jgi:hypothetical protein